MMDIYATPEMAYALQAEREQQIESRRWQRTLRELDRPATPGNIRRFAARKSTARKRRDLFAEALDAAQREGITVDAWFSYKFADPELSARAEWAGLIDEANKSVRSKSGRDVWAA